MGKIKSAGKKGAVGVENQTPSPDDHPPGNGEQVPHGKSLRKQTPRSDHGIYKPALDRRDPVQVLEESSADRVSHLLPIRYGRMLASPFAFYRGGAAIMAADLAQTPSTGLRVQACGDCHLMNFGVFATPERRLVFDVNDFDETLPAPWEWDVKRLATSFVIAGRNNRFKRSQQRAAAVACCRSYRQRMARFATMTALDVWYERVDVDELLKRLPERAFSRRDRDEIRSAGQGAVEHEAAKLLIQSGDKTLIRDNPPLVYHPVHAEAVELVDHLRAAFDRYRSTLPDERRVLLDRYALTDHAIKVVGVGSVGTRCGVFLLMAGPGDALFLQVKEAQRSVLEPYAGASKYEPGERVVVGQRLMQAASDLFLGWTHGENGRHFYIRQLRDVKIKPLVELYDAETMAAYAESCGWVLARAHARSGDSRAISSYLGTSDSFDEAVADFAESYADQNEEDFATFEHAVQQGRLPANLER
ncbi:MAG TPA: DUF2252 domain-containing protein [Pirellulales bacterium]|nr:DUF2252 domain-containing protein [Pirellulales bacterium]